MIGKNELQRRRRPLTQVAIDTFLSRERVETGWQVSSKKRLLERVSTLLLQGNPQLNRKTVFQILVERERLGSTGIGHGVALPHGRVNGLTNAIGALAILDSPLDYDALDQQEISVVFGLLVPAECNEEHLQILAHLASLFNDAKLLDQLLTAADAEQAYQLVTQWQIPLSD